jgi:phosphoribosylamine---glycine ligase
MGVGRMEKIGVLVVSYGAREAAIVDALSRSPNYQVDLYIADKQANPFNVQKAFEHVIIPDLNVISICEFALKHKENIDFAIVGPEKPIVEGARDEIEEQTGIPVICPKKQFAIEASKVEQRLLFQEIAPEANPRFKVFDPKDFPKGRAAVKKAVYNWLDELNNQAVVKPDKPTAGKGVGVWGDHFSTREELFEHFMSNYKHGTAVIIEEKIDGEESSFMAFCDGKHFQPLPDTRDHKRAFDDDRGPNTGGMGSYKDIKDYLPFMTEADRKNELAIAQEIFQKWSKKIPDKTALRGVPLYLAFMHTHGGPKILENNSRPGDPEIINLLPVLKQDFVDVCYGMIEGNLKRVDVEDYATVLTYKVPPSYGGYDKVYPDKVKKTEVHKPIDLSTAYALKNKYGDRIRVYPGSMELREGKTYALKSRVVGVLGIGEDIEEARKISLEGIKFIKGGALWNRNDVASKQTIKKSIQHMQRLRA